MNLKIKRIIFAILIISTCLTIFKFSAENSEKSSEKSSVIVNKVVDTVSTVNKKVKKESIKNKVTFYVRKSAHFSIYTFLGVWLMSMCNTFKIPLRKKIIICIVCGMLYAISDEFHQNFVSGRSAEIRDVCIDTCGVFFGSCISIVFFKLCKRKNKIAIDSDSKI